jgi:MFS family permease
MAGISRLPADRDPGRDRAGVAPLALIPGIWPMTAAITAAGLGISATLANSYRVAEMAVPAGQRTEAMSWLTTAAATGTALGAPLAGDLIDSTGPAAGYLFAFAAGLTALAITLPNRRRLTAPPGPRTGHPDTTTHHASSATRKTTLRNAPTGRQEMPS